MGIAHVLLRVAASCAVGDVAADDTPAGKVDFYLSAVVAERSKLRRGEFVVTGTKSVKDFKRPQFDYSGKLLILCVFDENRIRIDNSEPGIVVDLPLTNPRITRPGRIQRKFFRTPQKTVTWVQADGSSNIVIGEPDTTFRRFHFFDVRALGLTTWNQLAGAPAVQVETVAASLKKSRWEKTVDLSDPKYVQLVFLRERGLRTDELRYWLNRDQDFAPVRLESKARTRCSPDESWLVDDHAEIAWERIGGIWLPVTVEMTRFDETSEKNLAWRIRWRSVNKRCDDRYFNSDDFDAPKTVPIVDTTGRRPVVVRAAPR